ncbi:MAG: hypothetical protein RMJ36_05660 [Candidatus Calescibacterium sp.]|nr:hypothetical protein [Candidatus Calescibacterium sp.]MDW8133122.1 hypothetical protein [Candidatus Calescibacterium sp.]
MRKTFQSNNNKFLIISNEEKDLNFRNSDVDGIIFIDKIENNVVFFDLFNIDGSRAEVSGNGLACLTLFVSNILQFKEYKMVNSFFNNVRYFYTRINGNEVWVGFDMSNIDFQELVFNSEKGYILNIPNPHFVLPVFNIPPMMAREKAKKLFDNFKRKVNVHVLDVTKMYMYTFERGVGWTDSCGSGTIACAYVYNKFLSSYHKHSLTISSKGGDIKVLITENFYWISTYPKEI